VLSLKPYFGQIGCTKLLYDYRGQLTRIVGGIEDGVYLDNRWEKVRGTTIKNYYVGGQIHASKKITANGSTYVTFLTSDAFGNTVMEMDSQGESSAYIRYSPYGEVSRITKAAGSSLPGAVTTKRLFQGYRLIGTLSGDFYYAGARFYWAEIGRFLSPDPVTAVVGNPRTENPYAFALNNPLKYRDPSGLYPVDGDGNWLVDRATYRVPSLGRPSWCPTPSTHCGTTPTTQPTASPVTLTQFDSGWGPVSYDPSSYWDPDRLCIVEGKGLKCVGNDGQSFYTRIQGSTLALENGKTKVWVDVSVCATIGIDKCGKKFVDAFPMGAYAETTELFGGIDSFNLSPGYAGVDDPAFAVSHIINRPLSAIRIGFYDPKVGIKYFGYKLP
jgi:RHS repeat-associated protein